MAQRNHPAWRLRLRLGPPRSNKYVTLHIHLCNVRPVRRDAMLIERWPVLNVRLEFDFGNDAAAGITFTALGLLVPLLLLAIYREL
jgi:hypothetical protein